MTKTVLLIGSLDTKAQECDFLRRQIEQHGVQTRVVNVGVFGSTDLMKVFVEADEIASRAGTTLSDLREKNDRGVAMQAMADGVAHLAAELYENGQFDGVVGLGGTGGTSVVTAALRALPYGVPKVCITTAAGGDVSAYVGIKDIVLFPSIVDVAGVNRISRMVFARAAGAISGMVQADVLPTTDDKRTIAATMFGNTTPCVEACRKHFDQAGYEVLVFHATGAGGRTAESLIAQGLVDAMLDLTTTEWADEICGGVFPAGPDRSTAAGRMGIPQLIAPGCLDMVNFGPQETVPQRYVDAGRLLHVWNPSITLMRTSREENERLGKTLAERANEARGPVAFLLPLRGVSLLDGDDGPFCDRQADAACFRAIKSNLRSDIPVVEVDANINDPAFSEKAIEIMEQLLAETRETTRTWTRSPLES